MKVIYIISFIILLLNYKVNTERISQALGLWNDGQGNSIIGTVELPTCDTQVLFTLKGYQLEENNQLSTYNYKTSVISFIVKNSNPLSPNYSYLYEFNVKTKDIKILNIFKTQTINSIVSIQSTGPNDLLFIYTFNSNLYSIGKYNNASNSISETNIVLGQYVSAAFDSEKNIYSVISLEYSNFKFTNYSISGKLLQSQDIGPENQFTDATGLPFNLVYLSSFDGYYFIVNIDSKPNLYVIDEGNQIYSIDNPQAYIYSNIQSFAMAGDLSSSSNADPRYYQFTTVQPNSFSGQSILNTFDYSGYLNTYNTKVLPINMWVIN